VCDHRSGTSGADGTCGLGETSTKCFGAKTWGGEKRDCLGKMGVDEIYY